VVDEGMSGVTEEVERLVLTVREGEKGDGGEGRANEEEGAKQPVLKETEVASSRPADPTTPNRASTLSTGIRLNKSPVVKLHKVETPPSTSRPATLFSTLISRDSTSSTTTRERHCQTGSEQEQPQTEGMETDPASPMENKSLLELVPAATSDRPATNDILDTIDQLHHTGDQLHTREGGPTSGVCGSQPGLHRSPRNRIEITLKKEPLAGTPSRAAEQTSSQQMSSSAGGLTLPQSGDVMFPETSGLRRSPRKNKWISGQGKSSFSSRHQSASDRGKTNKKKLEQIVVGALKRQGMKRDHVCFRKCYTRLFNLSKSFLKDVRSSQDLVSEMHRVVDFNVSQVIDFELRQAHTTL
jgi:hypothetical protein